MDTRLNVAWKRTAQPAVVHAVSLVVFACWMLMHAAGCSGTQAIDCPTGFELNADGTECVTIRCEGGVIREGVCVCSDGTDLVDGTCTDSACIDVDCDDGNECTTDSCANGSCTNTNVSDGMACDGGDGACTDGSCEPTSELCGGVDCDDENPCTVDGVCVAETGLCPEKTFEPVDTVCDGNMACDGEGNCVECTPSGEQCSDANECTSDVCTEGVCSNPDSNGGPCNRMPGEGVCMAGMCEEIPPACQGVDCDDDNECTQDICTDGTCSFEPEADGTPCADDGNVCTTDSCIDGTCASTPIGDGKLETYFLDGDMDGFGASSGSMQACTSPGTTWVTQGGDCNDDVPGINPGAAELCDGIDNDCNGPIDDGSGFQCILNSSESCTTLCGTAGMHSCTASCQWGACVPTTATMSETCNGIDDDCDGQTDEGGVCPDGCTGDTFQGKSYFYCAYDETPPIAASLCDAFGFELVSINSPSENDFLVSFALASDSAPPQSSWYIYTSAEYVGSDWRWADGQVFWQGRPGGTPVLGVYENWRPGSPSNHPGGPRMTVCMTCDPAGVWTNSVAADPFPWRFICESQ